MADDGSTPLDLKTAHVGLIGIPSVPARNVEHLALLSNANIDSFDAMIWDPSSLKSEFGKLSNVKDGFSVVWLGDKWGRVEELLRRRTSRLLDLVKAGKTLVVISRNPLPKSVDVVERIRNQNVSGRRKLDFPLLDYLACENTSGGFVEYRGPSIDGLKRP